MDPFNKAINQSIHAQTNSPTFTSDSPLMNNGCDGWCDDGP